MAQQLALALDVPGRAGRRVAACGRETDDVYGAVTGLRAAGRQVYRSGGLHQVDGRLLNSRELLQLHEAELRRRAGGEHVPG